MKKKRTTEENLRLYEEVMAVIVAIAFIIALLTL